MVIIRSPLCLAIHPIVSDHFTLSTRADLQTGYVEQW